MNYYDLLQVERGCSKQDVKNAFRRLAKKYHPDINKSADAGSRFQQIYIAYETLSNDAARKEYDDLLSKGNQFGAKDEKSSFEDDFLKKYQAIKDLNYIQFLLVVFREFSKIFAIVVSKLTSILITIVLLITSIEIFLSIIKTIYSDKLLVSSLLFEIFIITCKSGFWYVSFKFLKKLNPQLNQ